MSYNINKVKQEQKEIEWNAKNKPQDRINLKDLATKLGVSVEEAIEMRNKALKRM